MHMFIHNRNCWAWSFHIQRYLLSMVFEASSCCSSSNSLEWASSSALKRSPATTGGRAFVNAAEGLSESESENSLWSSSSPPPSSPFSPLAPESPSNMTVEVGFGTAAPFTAFIAEAEAAAAVVGVAASMKEWKVFSKLPYFPNCSRAFSFSERMMPASPSAGRMEM